MSVYRTFRRWEEKGIVDILWAVLVIESTPIVLKRFKKSLLAEADAGPLAAQDELTPATPTAGVNAVTDAVVVEWPEPSKGAQAPRSTCACTLLWFRMLCSCSST